jgi:hypothetical protein
MPLVDPVTRARLPFSMEESFGVAADTMTILLTWFMP